MAKELPAKHQGAELCRSFNDAAKVCVYGGKYGFSAWLVSKATGAKGAPISVRGGARSPRAALNAAMQSARSTVRRVRRNPRRRR